MTPQPQVLPLSPGLCRRCVRALSRRLRELPGTVWFEIDVAAGVVRIGGDADPGAVAAVLDDLRCS